MKFVNSKNELKHLESNIASIESGLQDAEKSQEREVAVKLWLSRIKRIFSEVNKKLDEYKTLILKLQIVSKKKKVCSFVPSPCFSFMLVVPPILYISHRIKKLNEILRNVSDEMRKFVLTEGSIVEPQRLYMSLDRKTHEVVGRETHEFVGRNEDKKRLLSELLSESSILEERGLHIISVVGIEGIGKTALARYVYNDNEVEANFEVRSWICVSDSFDLSRIAIAIIRSLTSEAAKLVELESQLQRIRELLRGKKFLLVLDDVGNIEDQERWDKLKQALEFGAKGSRILVTTRYENVANMKKYNYVLKLTKMSEKESWVLMQVYGALSCWDSEEAREDLTGIAWNIAAKCDGIPLALKTLATRFRWKRTKEEWDLVLNSVIREQGDSTEGMFRFLRLGYDDLPSAIRRCFSYCAIFPKDHAIEVDKLIKLWMAQGFLSTWQNMEMEEVGLEYFKELEMRSFFQEITNNDNGSRTCKLESALSDFARHLTKDECSVVMDVGRNYPRKVDRHLTFAVAAEASFPISLSDTQYLCTLLVLSEFTSMDAISFPDLLCDLPSLRALDLSCSSLRKVPREVGKLTNLRYLNLAYNRDLKKLPKTICDLCHLQTLILNGCDDLEKLPQGMEKLIYLRHLEILWTVNLSFLPKGIGSLTSLRTLSRFFGSGGDGGKACNLGDLENLNYLEGYLSIDGLGNVVNVTEVEKANLKNKAGLVRLDLRFSGLRSDWRMEDLGRLDPRFHRLRSERRMEDLVLEALEPPSNLQYLCIDSYKGFLFPDWLMASTNLRELVLSDCSNCKYLPPLGNLQSLESLEIWDIAKVTEVGLQFLGIEVDEGDDDTLKKDAFPKLEKLSFYNMRNWENWDEIPGEVVVMPSLRSLTIVGCPKLKTLPHDYFRSTKLQDLVIKESPIEEYWTIRYLISQTSKRIKRAITI